MKQLLKTIKLNENTVSTFLSVVAVVMIIFLLINYVKSVNSPNGITSSSNTEVEAQVETNTYTVKVGDNLWSIAEEKYGSGYKWVELYEGNKDVITSPDNLEVGTKIKLLGVQNEAQVEAKTESAKEASYTVQTGDNLWQIAQNQCGDGFVWQKIATDNKLAAPGIIHKGNILKIRCN